MVCLTFYFDFSCPFAYLASTRIEQVAADHGATLEPRPFLLGGVFRHYATAQNLASTLSAPKAAHNLADMHRHADLFGVDFAMPPGHPFRTVTALRVLLVVARRTSMLPAMHAIYRAYWVDGVDISEPASLGAVLDAVPAADRGGLDSAALLAAAGQQEIKDALRASTDDAIAAGVFGAPAMVVQGKGPFGTEEPGPALFWGQDRLPWVRQALGEPPPPPPSPPVDGPPVEVWFDYSSPFTYFGVVRARAFLGEAIVWRPMLLGAVFKARGGPIVPLRTFNTAKAAYTTIDMQRQATECGAPFQWPSRFPLRTVLPLRATLFVLSRPDLVDRVEPLIHALFRLCWADDADPTDPAAVARCCDAVGLPGEEIVAATAATAVKHLLFAATDTAVARGVFGAPTFVVDPQGADPSLFWGNDRLPLVAWEVGRRLPLTAIDSTD